MTRPSSGITWRVPVVHSVALRSSGWDSHLCFWYRLDDNFGRGENFGKTAEHGVLLRNAVGSFQLNGTYERCSDRCTDTGQVDIFQVLDRRWRKWRQWYCEQIGRAHD